MITNRYTNLFVIVLICCTICSIAKGQNVCSGSALAPVFSQTFGQASSSTSKTQVPTGFTTSYTFTTGSMTDGNYMVTPLVENSQKPDWAKGGDHTGNSNGNMFLVNAGTGAEVFFKQEVNDLCPGSTYTFSAWVANVNTTSGTKPICGSGYVYPKVTFRIKNTAGIVLETYSTGDIPYTASRNVAPNWQQYGFPFTLPSGTTSLVLEMVDAYGGKPQCGNDLAIDDILFTACTPKATVAFSSGSSVCAGSSISSNVTLTNSPFTAPAYQWQKSTNGGSIWANIGTSGTNANSYPFDYVLSSDAASYRVLVGPDVASLSSNTCITASEVVTLTVNLRPSVAMGSNSPVCSGKSINLTAAVFGGAGPFTHAWTGPGGFSSSLENPAIANSTSSHSGNYSVVVTDNNSCKVSGSATVLVNTTPSVAAIAGNSAGCVGSTLSLSNASSGGTWSSSNTAVAAVHSSTGLVSLVSAGTATITYTINSGGCAGSASKAITAHSVTLPASFIECSDATINTQNNALYSPAYSNNDASSTYLWSISPAPNYQDGSSSTDRYPKIQYSNPVVYTISLQFTSAGTACTATQTVYRNGTNASSAVSGSESEIVCSPTNSVSLSASIAGYTNQFAWTSSGTGAFSNPNTLDPVYTFSAADKAGGQVVISFKSSTTLPINGNCLNNPDTDTKTLHIELPNTGTNTSTSVCSGQPFTHTASSSVSGSSFSWVSSVVSGTGSGNAGNGFGNINNTLVNLSATLDFVVRYTITPSHNGCEGTAYTVTVTIKPLPSLSIANNASNICTGTATQLQLSDVLSGTQYVWSSSVISGTATGHSSNASPTIVSVINDVLVNATNLAATVRYSITAYSSAGCAANAPAATDITVYPLPSTADAGSDQSLCNTISTTLSGNMPASGTGAWTQVSGANMATFTNASAHNTSITGLIPGTYVLRWTISNGVCTASKDDVTVTIYPATVPGIVSEAATVCTGTNSGTLSLTGNTGQILSWQYSTDGGTSWVDVANNTATYSYSNLTATTLYKTGVKNGVCPVQHTSPVTVSVDQITVAGTVAADITVCAAANSGTLSLTSHRGSIVQWESTTDNRTWSTLSNTTTTQSYTNLTTTTKYRALLKNGVCPVQYTSPVIVSVDQITVAGTVAADITVCAAANSGTLSLSSHSGSIVQWESTTDNSEWSTLSNTTTTQSYTNLTTTTSYRALLKNGVCPVQHTSPVTVSVDQITVAGTVAADITVCAAANSGTLSLTSHRGSIVQWESTTDSRTWSTLSNTTTTQSYTNLTTSTSYRALLKNGACPVQYTSPVTVSVDQITVAGTVAADITVCAAANSGTLSLTSHSGSIVQWESTTDSRAWSTLSNTTTTQSYTNLTTTTSYRALLKNGVCPVQHTSPVTVSVDQITVAGTVAADITVCAAANSGTLSLSSHSGSIVQWESTTDSRTWSTLSNTTTTQAYTNLTTTTSYRALLKNGACPVQHTSPVTVSVDQITVAGTVAADITVCAAANSGSLSLTSHRGSIISWESTTDNRTWSTLSNTTTTQAYTNLTATTSYRALLKNGVCPVQHTSPVTVSVDQITVAGAVSADITVCAAANSGTLSLSSHSGSIVQWESTTDNSSWSTLSNTTTTQSYTNLTATTSYRALLKNGVCPVQHTSPVTVSVDQITVAGTVAADITVCAAANSGTLSLSSHSGSIVQWESTTDNRTWSTLSNTTTTQAYTNLTTTTSYRALLKNGVCPVQHTSPVTVSVDQITVAGTVAADITVCAAANSGTLSLSSHSGSIVHWESTTDNSSWSTLSNTSATQTYTNLTTTTKYRALLKNGACPVQHTSPVTVSVDQITVAGTVSADITVCAAANSGTLSLSSHTGSIVQWESTTDNNTWSTLSNTTTTQTYTNLTTTTSYRALLKNGACPVQHTSSVTVSVDQITVAGTVAADITVCAAANSGTLSLTSHRGSIVQWESTTDNNTWSTLSNTTTTQTYTNLTTTTSYRALLKNGACPVQHTSPVTVSVDQITVAGTVAADITVCAAANSGTLSLSSHSGSIVQWESTTDNSSWSTLSNTTTTTQSYTNLTTSTSYRALLKNGVCPVQHTSPVTVSVDQITVAGTVSADITVCAAANSGTLSLSSHSGSIVHWESTTDNSTWSTLSNTTTTQSYTNLTTTTSYRALLKNGVCPVQYTSPVTVSVDQITIAGTVSADITVCAAANSGTLSLSSHRGSIVQWESTTDNSSWSTLSNTTTTQAYTNLTTTTSYRALLKNGVCPVQHTSPVTVSVDQITVAGTVLADITVCAAANSGTLSLTSHRGSIVQWESTTDNRTWSTINNATAGQAYHNISTTTQFRVLVKNGVCTTQYTTPVTITVVQPVTPADAGSSQVLCHTLSTLLSANTPVSGTGTWSIGSGSTGAYIVNAELPNTGITGLQTGTYTFKWVVANGVCPSSTSEVSIQVMIPIENTVNTSSVVVCSGQKVDITGTGASGGKGHYQYQWETSADNISWTPVSGAGNSSYSFIPASNTLLRRVVTSKNCISLGMPVTVIVQQALADNIISGNQNVCEGAAINPIKGTHVTGGDGKYSYYWEQNFSQGNAGWTKIDTATSISLNDIRIKKTTSFRRIVTTSLCSGPQSLTSNIVTITIKPLPQVSLQYRGGAYCSKDSIVQFTTTTQNVDSIRWDFGDGITRTTGSQKIIHQYKRPGTFVPTLLAISPGNCALSMIAKDTICIEEITPGFRLTGVFECGKTYYKFVDTSQSHFKVANLTWSINGAKVNSKINSKSDYQHLFTHREICNTKLKVESMYGCSNTASASFNVDVLQFPKVNINTVSEVCEKALILLKPVVNSMDSIIKHLWSLDNGIQRTDSLIRTSYASAGQYSVKLNVTTINKCYDSAMKLLTVHSTPTPQLPAEQILCKDDSLLLRANGAVNYIWKDQNDNIICKKCPAPTVRPTNNAQYNVIAYSRFGCSQIATTKVRVIQPMHVEAKLQDTICVGSSKRLAVTGSSNYQWMPSASLSNLTIANPVASPLVTTNYTVIGKDAFNCFADTAQIRLVVGNPTPVFLGKDTTILTGKAIQLHAQSQHTDIKKWKWGGADFSCLNCPSPMAKIVNDTYITCTATNRYGCATTDTMHIKTFCPNTEVFIPNAFTPDGDGINDKLFVQGKGIKLIKSFRIFNRWGEIVFEKTNFAPGDPSMGWDGKVRGRVASADVFIYACEVICEKGTPASFKGNVAIIK